MIENGLRKALTASLCVNCACVAWVGGSGLLHPSTTQPKAAPPVSTAELHVMAIQIASRDVTEGYDLHPDPNGDAADTDSAGHARNGAGGHGGQRRKGPSGEAGRSGDSAGSPSDGRSSSDRRLAEGKETGRTNAQRALTSQLQEQTDLSHSKTSDTARAEKTAAGERRETTDPHNPVSARQQDMTRQGNHSAVGDHRAQAQIPRDVRGGSKAGEGKNGQPSANGSPVAAKGSKAGQPGDSISPKMVKMARAKVNLGVVHLRRPKHGVTGGGYADMRNVDITAHFVVDDPNNKPAHLAPDKIVKKFKSRCVADPGNTSKCLPTGGNTRLGGTVLHGKDHITGVKYCIPGAGGIPGSSSGSKGQSSSSSRGRLTSDVPSAADRHVAGVYKGHDHRSVEIPDDNGQARLPSAGTGSRILHLPTTAADNRGYTPGAEVPRPDRKLVADPKPHADPGANALRLARAQPFTIRVRSVGSLSENGTVDWGKPHKAARKKLTHGGDGTGLMGEYFYGMNFNAFAFRRPDRNIDFDWIATPPSAKMPPNSEYSIRWTGKLVPTHTDTYTIMAASDDGERVYIDGKMILSNWSIHGAEEDVATIRLEAGREYSFRMEYFEGNGGAACTKLYWEGPSTPREYIPEAVFRYPKNGE